MLLTKMKNRVNGEYTGYWTLRASHCGRLYYEDVHVPEREVASITAKFTQIASEVIADHS